MFTDITATFLKSDIHDNRIISVFAYIPFLFFIPGFFVKRSPYAKFCANQGFVLSVILLIAAFASRVFNGGFFFVFFFWPLSAVFGFLHFAVLAVMIYGIYTVIKERAVEIPMVSSVKIFK